MDERILSIKGWMSEGDLEFLYNLIRRAPADAKVFELGTWLGRSTAALYMAMNGAQTVTTVDTWLGQPDLRFKEHRETLERDLFLEFISNMQQLGITPQWWSPGVTGATYLRMDCTDASTLVEDGSLDRLIIDCDHNRVGKDCGTWRPKMKPDGIICGHDYNWTGVKDQVQEHFPIDEVIEDVWVVHLRGG
jgi:predicted O-methyltransferase YrrM